MNKLERPELLFDEQYKKDNTFLRLRVISMWVIGIITFLIVIYVTMKGVC